MSRASKNTAGVTPRTEGTELATWHGRVPSPWIDGKPTSPVCGPNTIAAFKRDEHGRQSTLTRLDVLDTSIEEPFESIVSLVKQVMSVPMCAISLIDMDRQWFKARRGLEVTETPRDIAFCNHTILSKRPFIISDATKDTRFFDNPLVTGAPNIRSYAGIPLTSPEGYNIGSLCVIDTKPRSFSQDDISILSNFAKVVIGELELRQIASTDTLTGALSRRAWFDRVKAEVVRSARYSRALSLLILDIDHLKVINDKFGHIQGDMAIKQVAQATQGQLRQSDLFGRFGGEEFVCALPETDLADAVKLGERICSAVQNDIDRSDRPRCTISIGVSSVTPGEMDIQPAFERADSSLYRAKQGGRNRVHCADACFQEAIERKVA